MEHHSNIVPWQLLVPGGRRELAYVERRRRRARSTSTQLDALLADGAREARRRRPRLQRARARSTRSPRSSPRAHAAGALVAASTARRPCRRCRSTSARSAPTSTPGPAHKAYGPTGIGVLHGRRELLEAMPPFLGGGDMISSVDFDDVDAGPSCPAKFEAGTSPIAEAVGLGAAVDFLAGARHGRGPRARARARPPTRSSGWRRVAGPDALRPARRRRPRRARLASRSTASTRTTSPRSSRREGVCVRAGHHCAQPLMRAPRRRRPRRARRSPSTTRPSDVDRLVDGARRASSAVFGA